MRVHRPPFLYFHSGNCEVAVIKVKLRECGIRQQQPSLGRHFTQARQLDPLSPSALQLRPSSPSSRIFGLPWGGKNTKKLKKGNRKKGIVIFLSEMYFNTALEVEEQGGFLDSKIKVHIYTFPRSSNRDLPNNGV